MSLFFAELRKIWGGRVFPVLLAILASANLLLLWMGTRPTAKQPPASAYRAVGAELTGKGAPDLRGDAGRMSIATPDQDALDRIAVGQPEKYLLRLAAAILREALVRAMNAM